MVVVRRQTQLGNLQPRYEQFHLCAIRQHQEVLWCALGHPYVRLELGDNPVNVLAGRRTSHYSRRRARRSANGLLRAVSHGFSRRC